LRTLHPFPARMAPDIAMRYLDEMRPGSVVCDPMSGSGTVAALAVRKGLNAIAYDLDPLAALITSVRCSSADSINRAEKLWSRMHLYMKKQDVVKLPWIDDCTETDAFVKFWYGARQRLVLRRAARYLAFSNTARNDPEAANVLRLALSRIIIQKTRGASLAWDVSHSRPHKVHDEKLYDYDVLHELGVSVAKLCKALLADPIVGTCRVRIGDARILYGVKKGEADAVLTSPPYLNAIDYLRGHRLSLVWLGVTIPQARLIRSDSVGAEAKFRGELTAFSKEVLSTYPVDSLSNKQAGMVARYSDDLVSIASKAFYVLCSGGTATYVIGNNQLTGININNSTALIKALELVGFSIVDVSKRGIPQNSRYLPVNIVGSNSLNGRMSEEIVIHATRP
jgi:DNA modification methylase